MKNEFTYVELSDEQLELVVGGCHHHHHRHRSRQVGVAANFAGGSFLNQQNANATNQFARGWGFNTNTTWQTNFLQYP